MGGYGSGWYRYDKKQCVEDGLRLRASGYKPFVIEAHASKRSVGGQSSWSWAGEIRDRVGFTYLPGQQTPDDLAADGGGVSGQLRLSYDRTSGGERESVSHELAVEVRPCNFGGWRIYFRCPLSKSDQPCGRRCEKLYLPSGARYFGCR